MFAHNEGAKKRAEATVTGHQVAPFMLKPCPPHRTFSRLCTPTFPAYGTHFSSYGTTDD